MDRTFSQAVFSPELKLLCACCRVNSSDANLRSQAALAPLICPDTLASLAKRHRIEPLLYHNLKRHVDGVFPCDMLDALSKRVKRNMVKALHALSINATLARLMQSHGIPYLPLKGVTLAQRYYGEINLRHCNDIDFWIPETSLKQAQTLLAEHGCRLEIGHDFRSVEARGERHKKFLRNAFYHDVYIHPGGESLELHWRLTSNIKGLALDPINLLLQGESIDIAGDQIRTIGPIPLLLYLCEHGARHSWYCLKWLFDLPQVLESRDWNWQEVLVEAKKANCLSALLLGLKLAHLLFGWVVPDIVATAMEKKILLNWQVKMVCRTLNNSLTCILTPSVSQLMKHLIYRVSLIDNFGFLWNELTHHLLSPYDLKVVRLPDRWFMAYYSMRPFLFIYRKALKHRLIQGEK